MNLSKLSLQELYDLDKKTFNEEQALQSYRSNIASRLDELQSLQGPLYTKATYYESLEEQDYLFQADYELEKVRALREQIHDEIDRRQSIGVSVSVPPDEDPDDVVADLAQFGSIAYSFFDEATDVLFAEFAHKRDAEDAIKKLSSKYIFV